MNRRRTRTLHAEPTRVELEPGHVLPGWWLELEGQVFRAPTRNHVLQLAAAVLAPTRKARR